MLVVYFTVKVLPFAKKNPYPAKNRFTNFKS